ncbi:MAG: hypothetical protein EKK48_24160 [Candidatus Melainabacteria bacterium]|jgi:hypothetical protein|nr:MAG: hypothetical protein EKK48_24160 [Candidatus Melainabacteria bacterium]
MNVHRPRCLYAGEIDLRSRRSSVEISAHSELVKDLFNRAVDECFLRLFELKANVRQDHFCADCSGLVLTAIEELRTAQDAQEQVLFELARSLGYELKSKF